MKTIAQTAWVAVQYIWGFTATLYCFFGLFYTSCLALLYVLPGGKNTKVINAIIYQYVWLQTAFFAAVKLKVEGLENIDRSKTYIVTFNHSSLMDPPIGYFVLASNGFPTRMLGKAELFKVPIFGNALKKVGFVEVNRRNLESAKASYIRVKAAMAKGMSYWVAAEGSRTGNGRLTTFKKGGFITAIETGAHILPIAIKNANKVIPKSGWSVRAFMPVTVVIGPPIDAAAYTVDQKEALMERAFLWFASVLDDEQKPLPGTPIAGK